MLLPVAWLFFPESAVEVSGIIASGLAEMFLLSVQAVSFDLSVHFMVGVVSVSSILFLSASIPCVLATGIPLRVTTMLVIWAIRTLLSIPLAMGIGWLFRLSEENSVSYVRAVMRLRPFSPDVGCYAKCLLSAPAPVVVGQSHSLSLHGVEDSLIVPMLAGAAHSRC